MADLSLFQAGVADPNGRCDACCDWPCEHWVSDHPGAVGMKACLYLWRFTHQLGHDRAVFASQARRGHHPLACLHGEHSGCTPHTAAHPLHPQGPRHGSVFRLLLRSGALQYSAGAGKRSRSRQGVGAQQMTCSPGVGVLPEELFGGVDPTHWGRATSAFPARSYLCQKHDGVGWH